MIRNYIEIETGKELDKIAEIYNIGRCKTHELQDDNDLRKAIRITRGKIRFHNQYVFERVRGREMEHIIKRIEREREAIKLLVVVYSECKHQSESAIVKAVKEFLDGTK